MNYLKIILGVLIGGFLVWVFSLYKSNESNKQKALEQTENVRQLSLEKDLMSKNLVLNQQQFTQIIAQNQDLNREISQLGIKIKRVENLTTASFKAKDTIINRIDLTPVLNDLDKYAKLPFNDSITPIKTKGFVEYDNGKLGIVFEERTVEAKATYIRYWHRKWFLGRKHYENKTISDFGTFDITYIEQKKK